MTIVEVPPAELTVYLRLRCKSEPVPCYFTWHDIFECQLDTALLNDDRRYPMRCFRDAIGSKSDLLHSLNKCSRSLTAG